jgi:hypothetical protein
VHVFTDDRKKYPQIRDTAKAGSIPSITEIGQTEWPLTTVEILLKSMDEAGVDCATLVQAYFFYEYDNRYTVDSALAHPRQHGRVLTLYLGLAMLACGTAWFGAIVGLLTASYRSVGS